METWYRASAKVYNQTDLEIEPVKVRKSTKAFVEVESRWIPGRFERRAKITEFDCYFPTEEAAREHLRSFLEDRESNLSNKLSGVRDLLKRIPR